MSYVNDTSAKTVSDVTYGVNTREAPQHMDHIFARIAGPCTLPARNSVSSTFESPTPADTDGGFSVLWTKLLPDWVEGTPNTHI